MEKKYFKIGAQKTSFFKVGVSGYQLYNAPSRDIDTYHIHGRNGDIIADHGCFNNRKIVYNCWIAHTFKDDFDDFRDYLMSFSDKYYELTDNYHPDHLYMARVVGPIDPKPSVMLRAGEFDVEFDAKPQRFRIDGMSWKEAGTITNPTRHNCYPVLEISGAGTVTINEQTIKVNAGASFPITVDCEILEGVDSSNTLCNSFVELPLDAVYLKPGENTVTGSGCTVRVKPRWFDV